MADGVTVDANVISNFSHDYLCGVDSASRIAVEQSIAKRGIVVDEAGKIQQEWFASCSKQFIEEWFVEQIKAGKIRFVKPSIEPHHRKKLKSELGFPGNDLVYVSVCNVTETRYILTDDIDFFEPRLKSATHQSKQRAKDSRDGGVCRYLRKQMRITVGTAGHAISELFPAVA